MSKQQAQVKDKTFTVPDWFTKEDVVKYWNMQAKGLIIICPQCNKVDIDIRDHFEKCNPALEQQRQESQERYYV